MRTAEFPAAGEPGKAMLLSYSRYKKKRKKKEGIIHRGAGNMKTIPLTDIARDIGPKVSERQCQGGGEYENDTMAIPRHTGQKVFDWKCRGI